MIWYLLSPFRGYAEKVLSRQTTLADPDRTTEPPVLDSKHPISRAFVQYGSRAARHPVLTLLISSAVAAILVYPFPFLYTNSFAGGASNLPHHVWTSALPFEGPTTTPPDVIVRSIWVQGIYIFRPSLTLLILHRKLHGRAGTRCTAEGFGHTK